VREPFVYEGRIRQYERLVDLPNPGLSGRSFADVFEEWVLQQDVDEEIPAIRITIEELDAE
jgi:hypothetical protein